MQDIGAIYIFYTYSLMGGHCLWDLGRRTTGKGKKCFLSKFTVQIQAGPQKNYRKWNVHQIFTDAKYVLALNVTFWLSFTLT